MHLSLNAIDLSAIFCMTMAYPGQMYNPVPMVNNVLIILSATETILKLGDILLTSLINDDVLFYTATAVYNNMY